MICRMKGLRVLGYLCGSNVVRRGSKRDTKELYDPFFCTLLSSGLPLIGRSFKGSAGNKFRLASKKTAVLTRNGGLRSGKRVQHRERELELVVFKPVVACWLFRL